MGLEVEVEVEVGSEVEVGGVEVVEEGSAGVGVGVGAGGVGEGALSASSMFSEEGWDDEEKKKAKRVVAVDSNSTCRLPMRGSFVGGGGYEDGGRMGVGMGMDMRMVPHQYTAPPLRSATLRSGGGDI